MATCDAHPIGAVFPDPYPSCSRWTSCYCLSVRGLRGTVLASMFAFACGSNDPTVAMRPDVATGADAAQDLRDAAPASSPQGSGDASTNDVASSVSDELPAPLPEGHGTCVLAGVAFECNAGYICSCDGETCGAICHYPWQPAGRPCGLITCNSGCYCASVSTSTCGCSEGG
jgi:hypothetical protein